MEFCIFTEPQEGATYDDLLAVARATEELGFTGFFRSDHYMAMSGDGQPGPSDAWTTLAGLARDTSTIRLGTLVSSATHRHPGILAIQVANVDQMSGGRVELGLGTGWFEAEHTALGIPFPKKRFDLFEESLDIITGMWESDGPFSYTGSTYSLVDAPGLPKPTQAHVPIIVGGGGPKRTPAIAAKYADEFNIGFSSVSTIASKYAVVRDAAAEAGRTLRYSAALTTAVGRTRAEYEKRAVAIGRDPQAFPDTALGGTVAQVVDKLGELREIGTDRVYLQVMDLHDLDHLELLAREVVSQL
jgi:F420-dependent oxidoreductase-like protein